eukprot:GHVP01034000.1.p1 GENE.GHVP01034000.1~~GHVP01034000.1.p1  ORF type:complete len:192 (+),score=68.64 GHVP01034000.1:653-1228(+)
MGCCKSSDVKEPEPDLQADKARQAEEERLKAEQEKARKEERKRKEEAEAEKARLEKEAQEAERLRREEEEKKEAERLRLEEEEKRRLEEEKNREAELELQKKPKEKKPRAPRQETPRPPPAPEKPSLTDPCTKDQQTLLAMMQATPMPERSPLGAQISVWAKQIFNHPDHKEMEPCLFCRHMDLSDCTLLI